MTSRTVIIGNGVAGTTAALELRRRDDRAEITLVSDESEYFFSRTALMYALMDELTREELEPHERRAYDRQRIQRARARVTDLDADARTVTLSDGRALAYDQLVIATGSVARKLTVPGLEAAREGVTSFVSLSDLDAVERWLHSTRRAVVVGGGLIGVELVESLVHHHVPCTFVVREDWYWPAGLCREEGAMVERHLRRRGVDLRLRETISSVDSDASGRVSGVTLGSGERVACELLGVAIGVEPNVQWLSRCKSAPKIARGVLTDDRLRSSLAGVWAAGDCAEIATATGTVIEPLWYAAKRHGAFVGRQLSGSSERYVSPRFVNSAKFFGLEYTTVGDAGPAGGGQTLLYEHPTKEITVRLATDDGGALRGFSALGSRWDTTVLSRWMDERRPIDWVRERLRTAQFDHEFGRAPVESMSVRALEARA
jgi:NAD(P)H-nitrite reductase large subunit